MAKDHKKASKVKLNKVLILAYYFPPLGVGDALNGPVAGRVEEGREEEVASVAFVFDVETHVGVRIEQARHDRLIGQIDDGGSRRDRDVGPDSLNDSVLDQNDLIRGGRTRGRIDQAARFQGNRLGKCGRDACAKQDHEKQAGA